MQEGQQQPQTKEVGVGAIVSKPREQAFRFPMEVGSRTLQALRLDLLGGFELGGNDEALGA